MSPMRPHWDIFCRVIDNFGDIGVCWRLARQLANEFNLQQRLWVDDLDSLAALVPATLPGMARQIIDSVEVCRWPLDDFPPTDVADVVIEAFACDIPESYLQAMAQRPEPPRWINLEYLTAESWAEDCHGMHSPHPQLALGKTFFFPGFSSRSGGLPREADLLARRNRSAPSMTAQSIKTSIFCYTSAPLLDLISAMADTEMAIDCGVFSGQADALVRLHLASIQQSQSKLKVTTLPFVPQADFDQTLWQHDLNFVRGEDSFVRAQWAGRPFVWQIYPQEGDAHKIKLDAFLDLYCDQLPSETAVAVRALFHAWNGFGDIKVAWPNYLEQLPVLAAHARRWADRLTQQTDLATNLVKFCASKV